MTGQISDSFRHQGHVLRLVDVSFGYLFEPSLLGLKPVPVDTGCWRGYKAGYALSGDALVLDELFINLFKPEGRYISETGPVINGVPPMVPVGGHDRFNNHYLGLNYGLNFTGNLLLADGFIDSLYVHMGFQDVWKYERVLELIFKAGVLQKESDRSEEMAEVRKKAIEDGLVPKEEPF